MVGVGEAIPFVLDCYTGQLSIGIKELVGYNQLELRTRYKFRELSTYWFTYLAIELIFEI